MNNHMPDFVSAIEQHKDLSLEAQKKAGQAAGDDMDQKHKEYLAMLIGLLDRKEIDLLTPQSFLKHDVYDTLPETSRGQVDLTLLNLADQIRRIEIFFRSKQTPNASPELQTMIEHLWLMKGRVEEKFGPVFKF